MWPATAGTHTVQAFVDDVNRIAESNENNNTLSSTLTVGSGGLPDLIVTNFTWSPTIPAVGQPVLFSATIKNQGTAATPDGVIAGIGYQVDGTTVTWSGGYTSSIPAGSSVTLTANGGPSGNMWTATAGTHTVQAFVDDVNRIAESNENNNTLSSTLTVGSGGLPDLIVTNFTWSPTIPAADQPVLFSATIKNQGTAATPDGVIAGIGYQVDGATVTWSGGYASSIPAGSSVTLTANGGPSGNMWTATAGTHTVQAFVDDVNRIAESNENNNTLSNTLTVGSGGLPDLIVTNFTWSPTIPAAGQPVLFSATIKNQGTAATPDGVIAGIGYQVDGATVTWSGGYASSIPAGSSVTLTANGGPSGNMWT